MNTRPAAAATVALWLALSPAPAAAGSGAVAPWDDPATASGPTNGTPPPETSLQSAPKAGPSPSGDTLSPFVVSEPAYVAYLSPSEKIRINLFWRMIINLEFGLSGRNLRSSSVVTPLRAPQRRIESPFTVKVLDGKEVRADPSTVSEGPLASEPEFGFTDRDGAPSARGADRGASLRGVGAGGPSPKVLLDGVPFNDPFGGWVPWIDAPREGLARLEVVPGGGSTAWGDGALGGVIQLITFAPSGALVTRPGTALGDGPPDPDLKKPAVVGMAEMSALFGSFDTRDYEFVAAQPTDQGVLQVLGNVFATDGYPIVARQSRGPVDISAWNRHDWFEARWRQPLGKTLVLTTTVRTHEESSGDGTPFQQGSSSGRFALVSVAGQPSALVAWSATSYVQEGQAAQTLSLVNSNRTAETPVLDNTGIPETAAGASWNGVWRGSGESTISAGADLRLVRAETRNEYAFQDGAFSRSLVAGGEQGDIGVYFLRDQSVVNTLHATLGARIDTWREAGGYQLDTGLASDAALGTEHYPAENGTEFCPSAGLVWVPAKALRLRLNGQRAFSRPTLADLFQPAGGYSIVTEANPLLSTERCTSLEAGAEYVLRLERTDPDPRPDPSGNRPSHPSGTITLGATFFSNELRDAIGTDALAPNSNAAPIFGSLPAGYFGDRRINIDRSRIDGAVFAVEWTPAPSVSLDASLLCNDPIIVRAGRSPAIEGNQIAGVARHSAAIDAKWIFSEKVTLRSRLRVLGPEFEDDENTIRLGPAVILDAAAAYALTKHIEFSLSAVNLGDARVQASRSLNGVEYVSYPRMVQSGLRITW